MQIRISWQALAAALIFLAALAVAGRVLLGRVQPAGPGPTPQALTTVAPAPTVEQPAPTMEQPTPTVAPPAPSVAAAPPSPTPRASAPLPSAALPPTPAPTVAPTAGAPPTPTPEPVAVVARGFAQQEGEVTYGFTARNPNPELIARDTRYQLIAYSEAGAVLRTDSGTIALIGPGEQTGVAGALTLAGGQQVARVEVVIGGALFVQAVPQPPLVVENLAFVAGEAPAVTGIVRNPYPQDLEDLPVVALVYDQRGAIIGGGAAALPFVPAGGQAAAEVPVQFAGEPSAVELYPRPSDLLTP